MRTEFTYFTTLSNIEDHALTQIRETGAREHIDSICIFPDIHYCSEKSIPIGLAFASRNAIYPLVTGKDMGCGVAYMKIPRADVLKPFDKHKHYQAFHKEHLKMTDEGLGGGNHFLSLEEDHRNLYIIVHTGTRNRGIYMYQKHLAMLREAGDREYFTEDFQEHHYPQWFDEYEDVIRYGVMRRSQFLEGTLRFLEKNGYVSVSGRYECGDSVHNHIRRENGMWIHRKGATELNDATVVIPLSMTRGSLLVQKIPGMDVSLNSCSHGAGRRLSRTDTLKHWHSLKKKERRIYEERFGELLERNGKFSQGYIQEFDFAYKDSAKLLSEQPFLRKIAETVPVCTIKFSEI